MKKNIIKKWYSALNFPEKYDTLFKELIDRIECENFDSIDNYKTFDDKEKNLLAFLYFCEELAAKYKDARIPEKILYDTLSDIVIWTNTYFSITGKLGLDETNWLKRHLSFKLFKLGRLQFCIADSEFDIPSYEVSKGDQVVEVHIPEYGPLIYDECEKSFENAKEFFEIYFRDYNYKCFTCHSWLLDRALLPYLNEGSNIRSFMTLFVPVHDDDSYALIKYIFRWDARKETLASFEAKSTLAKKIAAAVNAGVIFHETLGVRAK